MKRGSYLNQDLMREIRGRLKFAARSIEEIIEEKPGPPERKPFAPPSHPLDEQAAHFGLRGYELKSLQEEAMSKLYEDPSLLAFYKRFLIVAKLKCPDAVAKADARERRAQEDKNLRDRTYAGKVLAWENRKTSLTKSWTEGRQAIKTRWRKILKSLAQLIETDARFETMDDNDVMVFKHLEALNHAALNDTEVVNVNFDLLMDLPIEDVNDITGFIESLMAPGGVWPKKVKDEEPEV